MDFITGPNTRIHQDLIWVIMDRMTKSSHFLQIKTLDTTEDYAKLYVCELVRLYGIPLPIISN